MNSPNKALEAKAFSSEFWRWQHRYLLDAVEQFGTPSLFITISPYEWTFPFPPWMESLHEMSGKNATSLASHSTHFRTACSRVHVWIEFQKMEESRFQ